MVQDPRTRPATGKPEARRARLAARRALSEQEHAAAEEALLAHLRPLVLAARRVASYASFGTEPRTGALNALRDDVLVPVVLPDRDLDWADPSGTRHGREALAACDLVLVPALAVDRRGTRLGRGGGSYDRALRRARGRVLALLHDGEVLDSLPADPHDVPVQGAVTPSGGVLVTDPFADVLQGNAEFAADYADAGLAGRAAKGLAVVTCMDSRIDPLRMLGLTPGDAKILRTAGARVTDDVLRSLVLAHHVLGVDRVLVAAHTDCGMAKATDDQVHALIKERSGVDSRSVEFRTIGDQQATLRADVQRVRSSPYLPAGMPVLGAVYDVRSGRLEVTVPVEEPQA